MKTTDRRQTLLSYAVNLAAVALLFLLINYLISSGMLPRRYQSILMFIFINIILAASLNLTTGFLGQIALGHAGFMSIGAYTGALFSIYVTQIPAAFSGCRRAFREGQVGKLKAAATEIPRPYQHQ